MSTRPGYLNASGRWWLAVALLLMLPFLFVDIPPLGDLPGHMARYAIQVDDGRSPFLARYYAVEWNLIGNLGVDLLVQALAPILGLERSVWWVVALIPVITGVAVVLLSRVALGSVSASLPWALIFAFGKALQLGIVNYSLSLALALCAFAVWIALADRSALRAILFLLIMPVMFVVHVAGWGVLGLLIGGYEVGRLIEQRARPTLRDGRRLIGLVWPLIPSMVLPVLANGGAGGVQISYGDAPLFWKARIVATALRDTNMWLDLASLGAALVVAAGSFFVGARLALRFTVPVILLIVAVMLTPWILFGSGEADLRLVPAPFLIGFALLDWSRVAPGVRRSVCGSGLALFLVRLGATSWSYSDHDRVYDDQLAVIDRLPVGARVLVLHYKPCSEDRSWRLPQLDRLDGIAVVRKSIWSNSNWDAAGGQLLRIRYRPSPIFYHWPSQIVAPVRCATVKRLSLESALAKIPTGGVDFVWLFHSGSAPAAMPARARLIARSSRTLLWQISAGAPIGLAGQP